MGSEVIQSLPERTVSLEEFLARINKRNADHGFEYKQLQLKDGFGAIVIGQGTEDGGGWWSESKEYSMPEKTFLEMIEELRFRSVAFLNCEGKYHYKFVDKGDYPPNKTREEYKLGKISGRITLENDVLNLDKLDFKEVERCR